MENMDSIWGFIGIIVFACGVYAIYSFIKMKSTGEINASLLLGKDYMYKTCKNKEEYIKKAGPALLRIQKGGACRLWRHRRLSSFKISLKSLESTRRAPSA